jgi:hypothetical protein
VDRLHYDDSESRRTSSNNTWKASDATTPICPAGVARRSAPVPGNFSFFRVADQWDSGNGMCHRSLLEKFGLFDQQYDRQRQ